MGSRTKTVLVSPESIALKELREKREMSLQKLADHLGLSKPMVHQKETGRANIGAEYVDRCLIALDYTRADFEAITARYAPQNGPSLRQRCQDQLDKVADSKLEKVFDYLLSFT